MGGNQRTAESQNFRPLLHFPGFSLMKIHMRIYNYGARDLRAYKLRQRLSMYFPPSLSSSINRVDPTESPSKTSHVEFRVSSPQYHLHARIPSIAFPRVPAN